MRNLITAVVLAIAAAAPAAAQDEAYDAGTVLATVNGAEITLGHVIAMQQRLPEQYQNLPDEALFEGVLDQLIEQTLLAQMVSDEPQSDPLDVRLQIENERRGALAARVVQERLAEPMDEAEARAAYDAQIAQFTPQPEFNASHILVATQEEAAAILVEIEAGADFAALAEERSSDGSAASGGSLGWFGPGQMVAPFEAAVTEMEVGDVAGPVETQFGWHLIKLDDKRETAPPAFEEVREQVETQMRQQALRAEVDALRASAEIEVVEDAAPPASIRENALLEN